MSEHTETGATERLGDEVVRRLARYPSTTCYEDQLNPYDVAQALAIEVQDLRAELAKARSVLAQASWSQCGCLGGMLSDYDVVQP